MAVGNVLDLPRFSFVSALYSDDGQCKVTITQTLAGVLLDAVRLEASQHERTIETWAACRKSGMAFSMEAEEIAKRLLPHCRVMIETLANAITVAKFEDEKRAEANHTKTHCSRGEHPQCCYALCDCECHRRLRRVVCMGFGDECIGEGCNATHDYEIEIE